MGMDPRQFGRLSESLLATTRLSWGGLTHQAVAAIENACLDICAKSLGVPVHALFGGPFRERVPVYWSHCGSHPRAARRLLREPRLRARAHPRRFHPAGARGSEQGLPAVKTNPVFFDETTSPTCSTAASASSPASSTAASATARSARSSTSSKPCARASGPDRGLMLDVNFSQRTEGYLRLARRLEPLNLYWLEIDMRDPEGIALIRQATATPIASLELLHGIHDFRPYLAAAHGRYRHRRSDLERRLAVDARRDPRRRVRDPRGAAQPGGRSGEPDERASLRRDSQFPHHGAASG